MQMPVMFEYFEMQSWQFERDLMSYSAIVMALLVQKRLISIMAQFNPVSYWGSALLKKPEVQDVVQGKVAWSCLLLWIFSYCLHL